MPIAAIWREDGIEYHPSGEITAQEVQQTQIAFAGDPRSDAVRYKIIDMRNVEAMLVSDEASRMFGAFEYGQTLSIPHVRMAFIVPDGRFDGAIDAFTHLIRNSNWQVRTFGDIDAARSWAVSGNNPAAAASANAAAS